MAWSVGAVCAQYAAHGMGMIVLQAVFLTASVTVALTVYTLRSKTDFSFLGAGLGSALWVLIFGGLIASLTGAAPRPPRARALVQIGRASCRERV